MVLKKKRDSLRRQYIPNKITKIFVNGYKSINEEKSIDIKPLTILGGTNSSGKSTFIQPLLLMKQTLEESFDPGPLLLNGPHVKFSSFDQLTHTDKGGNKNNSFTIGFEVDEKEICKLAYSKNDKGITITEGIYRVESYDKDKKSIVKEIKVNSKTSNEEIKEFLPEYIKKSISQHFNENDLIYRKSRQRCFYKIEVGIHGGLLNLYEVPSSFNTPLRNIIHLPGLRGNPERNYPTTFIDSESDSHSTYLPGKFEKYVASLIYQWQLKDSQKLRTLESYLKKLKLTDKVNTEKLNDTQVSINVGRGVSGEDWVNIADVGLGVSQTLPVLVALVYAKPGQMVYLEQPEIHLHPRAQYDFAEILGEAVNKGIRVVIETHSSLIIKGIQTAVAKGKINNRNVALHWFSKNKGTGETEVASNKFDSDGAFGDWPIDFDDIELRAEMEFLNALED